MNPNQTPPMGDSLIIGGPGSRLSVEQDATKSFGDFSSLKSCATGTGCYACSNRKPKTETDKVDERIAELDKQQVERQAERQAMKKTEQKKVDTDNFVWFNPEFTFSVIAGSDGKYRTRVPVPGCAVEDVTVTQTRNRVEVKSQLKLKDAHCTNVAVGELPRGHVIKSATVKEGLLTLVCEQPSVDLPESKKISVRGTRTQSNRYNY